MNQETVVAIVDIQYVCITCKECGTQIILDMNENFEKRSNAFTPKQCAGCHHEYDSAIISGVDAFHHSYQALAKMENEIGDGRVSFKGKSESWKSHSKNE